MRTKRTRSTAARPRRRQCLATPWRGGNVLRAVPARGGGKRGVTRSRLDTAFRRRGSVLDFHDANVVGSLVTERTHGFSDSTLHTDPGSRVVALSHSLDMHMHMCM
eukprot:scaffold57506_cov62-Phaeocystis_antarctica.AAC.6